VVLVQEVVGRVVVDVVEICKIAMAMMAFN